MNLLEIQEDIVDDLVFNVEAKDYKGCSYRVKNTSIIQRNSKSTPKKDGQFVTLWKRNKQGETCPLELNDTFDFVIIICVKENFVGRFLFPKNVLVEKGYISTKSKEGKRGFRVYPNWDRPTSKQAVKTQSWQLEYFKRTSTLDINDLIHSWNNNLH